MNYILFEDLHTRNLYPHTINHASFEVRCGAFTNIERVIQLLNENDTLTLIVRDDIQDLVRERFPRYSINPQVINSGICLNGASIWSKKNIDLIQDKKSFSSNDTLVAFHLDTSESIEEFRNKLESRASVTTHIELTHFTYLWDSINSTPQQLSEDSNHFLYEKNGFIHPSAVFENEEEIFTGTDCQIKAGVVIDASSGPVIIMKGATLEIGSLIQGPVFIGENCTINPGTKLRGNVVLGNRCKIGGEVEDSIFQGFSNKQHDGFIGHSYIGEWVNLGANTNNSDLKNNYSKVRFNIGFGEFDTGQQFLGSCIGDYSRTGISTMLNTGTFIGLGANVFGSDFQEKYIPSFSWGKNDVVDINKFISMCKIVKERRSKKFTDGEKEFIIQLSQKTTKV